MGVQSIVLFAALVAGASAFEVTLVNIFGYPTNCTYTEDMVQLVFGVGGVAGPTGCHYSPEGNIYVRVTCGEAVGETFAEHWLPRPNCRNETDHWTCCDGDSDGTHEAFDVCTDTPGWSQHAAYRCEVLDTDLVDLVELHVFASGDCDAEPTMNTVVKVGPCLSQNENGPHYRMAYTNAEKSEADYFSYNGPLKCDQDPVFVGHLHVAPPQSSPECAIGLAYHPPPTRRDLLVGSFDRRNLDGIAMSAVRVGDLDSTEAPKSSAGKVFASWGIAAITLAAMMLN